MPINYDEIIKKAEQRRAALQQFSEALQGLETSMDHLNVVFAAARELTAAKKLLDDEAMALLGHIDVSRTVGYAESIVRLHHVLDQVPFSGDSKTYRQFIEGLLDKVK